MRSFELNIFIDAPIEDVYSQLAEPINMIGLQPFMTTIDLLKEQKAVDGTPIRPFNMVETYRWLGLPIFRSRVYTAIHATKPKAEVIYRAFRKPGIRVNYRYQLRHEGELTQVTQRTEFEEVSKLLETMVVNQTNIAQRALLTNLKVRLEKN